MLADHRRELGTRAGTRALTCWKQAVIALAWFRDRPDVRKLGGGSGISQATAYRYKDEAAELPAVKAPTLRETLGKAAEQGLPYLILDGTLVSSDRCADKKPARRGRRSISGTPARRTSPPGTCGRWPRPAGCRCGSPTSCPAFSPNAWATRCQACGASTATSRAACGGPGYRRAPFFYLDVRGPLSSLHGPCRGRILGLAGGLAAGLVSMSASVVAVGFKWPWSGNEDGIWPRLFVTSVGLVIGALVAGAAHSQMSGGWPAFIMGISAPSVIRGALSRVEVSERKPDTVEVEGADEREA